MQAIVPVRRSTVFFVCLEGFLDEPAALCQTTIERLDLALHLLNKFVDVSLAFNSGKEVFDSVVPEFEEEAEHANVFIVVSLLPEEHKLCLTNVKRIGYHPFPEARWVGRGLYILQGKNRGAVNGRFPLWVYLLLFKPDERAACLFTNVFARTELVDSGQDISSIGMAFSG